MKKGISLVALVITIIVLIILTATVILTTFNNGLLDRSEEAVFKNNVRTFQEDFANKRLKAQNKNYTDKDGQKIDVDSIDASNAEGNITQWIPSITNDFIDKIFIEDGIFKADISKFTEEQIAWLEDLGIEMGLAPVIGTTAEWQLDETNTIITAYIGPYLTNSSSLTIPNKVKDATTGEIYNIKEVSGTKVMSVGTLTIADNLTFNTDITHSVIRLIIGDNVTFNNGCDPTIDTKNDGYIIIGDNVKITGGDALTGTYEGRTQTVTIGDNFYCDQSTFLSFHYYDLEEIIIGDNATLAQVSIHNNDKLKKLTIGKGLNILDPINNDNRFLNNNALLEEVNIASFKNLGANALRDCTLLEKVVLEDGGVISGSYAFGDCTGIKEVILGNADMSSSSATNTFSGCTGIEKVTIKKGAGQNLKGSLFSGNTSIKEVVIEDNCTAVNAMFGQCTGITNVSIGNNVTIKASVFNGCSGLTSIKIPGSTILNQTTSAALFVNCKGLTKVEFGEGIEFVPNSAFQGCTSLTDVILPTSLKTIGNSFVNCDALENINIPKGVTTIGQAFSNCDNLAIVTIPSSVTSITTNAFSLCPNLTITVGSEAVKTLVEASGFTGTVTVDASIG